MLNSVLTHIQQESGSDQPASPSRSLRGFIKKILNDWSSDFSSLLTYAILTAILPIFVATFGILGVVFQRNPSIRQTIIDSVVNSLSDNNTKTAIQEVTNIAANRLENDAGGILALNIIFSIWSGSRLFVSIDSIFTIIHRTAQRSFIYKNLIAIGMVILLIFLIIIMFGASIAPSFVINALPGQYGAQFGVFVAGIVISYTIAFILYMSIYFIVPNKKMKLKDIWCGALITTFLLEIFLILFPLYIRKFPSSFIGLIGFGYILVIFFSYFSLTLIMGAQINAYFFERIQPLPDGLGSFISQNLKKITRNPRRPRINSSQYFTQNQSERYY